MRIALVAAVCALLIAGRGAVAEDLSGRLEELESGARAPSGQVQIVPGVDQPTLVPAAAPAPDPDPEGAAPAEPALEPDEDAEAEQDEDEPAGVSLGGGAGLTVEPHVPNATRP
jgi:hypothetical protein